MVRLCNDVVNMITKNTINQVLGSGGTPSVQAISNEVDWDKYAQLLADNPDIFDKHTRKNG